MQTSHGDAILALEISFAFPSETVYLAVDSKRELALRILGGDEDSAVE